MNNKNKNKNDENYKLYCYDYDNTLVTTEFGLQKGTNFDIIGYKIFGDYYKAVKQCTELTFEEVKYENSKKYNLPAKGKFYKFSKIYEDLNKNNQPLQIDTLYSGIEDELKQLGKGDTIKDFDIMKNDDGWKNIIPTMKENAINLIDEFIKSYSLEDGENNNSKIELLKKDKWNLWQFIDDKVNIKNLLGEYRNKIKNIDVDKISITDAVEQIFYPMSALYEVFGNEPVRINLDLITKIMNHNEKDKNNILQCINTLKDKKALIETMKLFQKIGNDSLKEFSRIFYEENNGKIIKDMIVGTTEFSSKRRKIRALELLYLPKIKEVAKNKDYNKFKYIIVGDSIEDKAGKDSYTLTSLINLSEKDLEDFKQLLRDEYGEIGKQIVENDNNLSSIDNLRKFIEQTIVNANLYIETRLLVKPTDNEIKQKEKVNLGEVKNKISSEEELQSEINKEEKALKFINNENGSDLIQLLWEGTERQINNSNTKIENGERRRERSKSESNKYSMIKSKDIIEGKLKLASSEDIEVKIHLNNDMDKVRPLLKTSFKDMKRDVNRQIAYDEYVRNKEYKKYNNFTSYIYNNVKNRKNKDLPSFQKYIEADRKKKNPDIQYLGSI